MIRYQPYRFIGTIFRSLKPALPHYLGLLLTVCINPCVLADVSVDGLNDEQKDNAVLMLSLAKEPCTEPEWKIRDLFKQSENEIGVALRALGYYHPTIDKSLTFNDDCWQAHFTVAPGPQTVVSSVSMTITGEAENDPAFQQLRESLLGETGKPLRHDRYESMKKQIESLAQDRGYIEGRFSEHKLFIDKNSNTARIALTFEAGKRMRFGEINVDQSVLNPGFVEKLLSINNGDYYSSEQLAKTHNNLAKSGYFDMIDIQPDTANIRQDRVPVTLKLHPKSKHHYGFGAGFDTDIGPLLSAAYSNRRVNRSGHLFDTSLDLSPVLATADAEYTIPLAKPISDFFSFGGGFKREDNGSYKSVSAKLSARLKYAFDNGWKQTLFLDAGYEDFTVGANSEQVLLLVPGGSWLRSVSDNPMRPTQGYRLEFNTAGSYKNPISDVGFAQASLAAVWTHPLFSSGRFIARTELGATLVHQFDRLPTTYRFYAGGMNSIRGYSYKELGAKDMLGNVAGGRYLTVASAEYEHSILENWSIATFIDAGNAYNADSINIKAGTGLGLRWYSPFGPVRMDIGIPLRESDSSFQIHFAAGSRL